MACKIDNLNLATQEIMENAQADLEGRKWLDSVHRASEGRKLVMREIKILSKLSHVSAWLSFANLKLISLASYYQFKEGVLFQKRLVGTIQLEVLST